jgi:hypothetical protein
VFLNFRFADGAASKGASSLVALYNFYYNRSKALAESVVELLENADKDLKSELEQDISVENRKLKKQC